MVSAGIALLRVDKTKIEAQKNMVESIYQLRQVLDALPYVAAILNEQRQVIYSNQVFLDTLGGITLEKILGLRLGEAMNCANSNKGPDGCGTSEHCRLCGAYNTVIESQQRGLKVSKECRIIASHQQEPVFYDFLVTATPFIWEDQTFTIVSLSDISHEKRRKALERIFFHDIINKAGNLTGFLELLKDVQDKTRISEYLTVAESITQDIIEEILVQRALLAAESGELVLEPRNVFSLDVIRDNVTQIMYHSVAQEKSILIANDSVNLSFRTDTALLNRVLTNMLKNALESTSEGELVETGCTIGDKTIIFWVHNQNEMPNDIKLQVFQRSFSSKGSNRGLGTYSMKLLSEKYLSGKVYFKSEEGFGTRFYVELKL